MKHLRYGLQAFPDGENCSKKNGSLKPEYRETRKRKIDLNELERALERKPDATLSELARLFDCTKQAIDAALKRLKITLKKKPLPTPKDEQAM